MSICDDTGGRKTMAAQEDVCDQMPQRDVRYLTPDERQFVLRLARRTLEHFVSTGRKPVVDEDDLTSALTAPADCFVTLRHGKDLRGCIGQLGGTTPLWEAVIESAIGAAARDPRFAPVRRSELSGLRVEVSVLTPRRKIPSASREQLLASIEPDRHGVVLERGPYRGLYLPQVWASFEPGPDRAERFLSSLSQKAGDYTGTVWMDPSAEFEVFEADVIEEEGSPDGE